MARLRLGFFDTTSFSPLTTGPLQLVLYRNVQTTRLMDNLSYLTYPNLKLERMSFVAAATKFFKYPYLALLLPWPIDGKAKTIKFLSA